MQGSFTATPKFNIAELLGGIHVGMRQFDEARTLYQSAIAVKPTSDLYFKMGHLYMNYMHQYAQAREMFVKYLRMDGEREEVRRYIKTCACACR